MENIIRNVPNVKNGDAGLIAPPAVANGKLPVWCNVYEGLTDPEIAELEKTVLVRTDLARSSE